MAAQLGQAINNKTKPLSSLGALKTLARQLGLIQQTVAVSIDQPAIMVFAGDHGFAHEPAMIARQCATATEPGAAMAASLPGNVVGFGEMGIGNTTAAAALTHKLAGIPVTDCVGAGSGLLPDGVLRKQRVIEAAVARHAGVSEALDVLATFDGFEIAMMAGAMLKAAAMRETLLIDGFIVTSALLAASRMAPAILDYCVFAHCSDEARHRRMLDHLGARPLLQLGMRLGEGTGAALALPLLRAAAAFLNEMATFSSASVSEKSEPALRSRCSSSASSS